MNNKQAIHIGIDGFQRPKDKDYQISQNIAQIFSSDTGKEVIRYLRSISIETVHGSNVSTEELRHVEGQRYIVGVIENRINHAHRIKTNV